MDERDLTAVHNLTEEKLLGALKLGGLPSPSVAVVKAENGFWDNDYGDISLIFGKDSIDPEADSRNMVYGSDAWTPTKPILERKVNYKVQNQFDSKIYKLSDKAFDGVFKRSSVIGSRIGTDVTKLSAEELKRVTAPNG